MNERCGPHDNVVLNRTGAQTHKRTIVCERSISRKRRGATRSWSTTVCASLSAVNRTPRKLALGFRWYPAFACLTRVTPQNWSLNATARSSKKSGEPRPALSPRALSSNYFLTATARSNFAHPCKLGCGGFFVDVEAADVRPLLPRGWVSAIGHQPLTNSDGEVRQYCACPKGAARLFG